MRAPIPRGKKVRSCGCKNWEIKNVYYAEKKANVYHKLERKEQSTMAFARPVRAEFQDLEST